MTFFAFSVISHKSEHLLRLDKYFPYLMIVKYEGGGKSTTSLEQNLLNV